MLCSCGICSRIAETENGVCLKLSILCARYNGQRCFVSAEKPSNDREEEIKGEEAPLMPYCTTGKRRRLSLDSLGNGRPIKTLKPALEEEDDDEESDYYTSDFSSDEETSEDEDENLNPEQLREKILEYRAEKEALLRERARLEQKVVRMEAEHAIMMKIGL